MKSRLLLTGFGLRPAHYQTIMEAKPPIAWLEVHSENYFADGGKPIMMLEKIRRDFPISLHGVSLSLGSTDELNWSHLKKLRDLAERVDACLVSEHLSWSSINGHYLHDLLPLPYTEEALAHLAERIDQVQQYLNRQIIIENISSYISYKHSTLSEWDFLVELAKRTNCGILLDINNIYVSAKNLGFSTQTYLNAIPPDYVKEFHLAGHTMTTIDNQPVLIDSHNQCVTKEVWELYQQAVAIIGRKPTIIEWDSNLPSLDTLYSEAYHAETIMREAHVLTKSAS